jgi:hypothetical protein
VSNDALCLATRATLHRDIKSEEEFRRGSYINHLEAQSSCGHHCLRHLLSTANDGRFCAPCQHGPPDPLVGVNNNADAGAAGAGAGAGAVGATTGPKTMVEEMMELHNRKPKSSDWNDQCEVCSLNEVNGHRKMLLMCSHCNVVAHKSCIETWMCDLPQKEEEWTCVDCQRDIDSVLHSTSCAQCCEADRLIARIKIGIDLLHKRERQASSMPSSSSSSSMGLSSSINVEGNGVKRASASEVLKARLQAVEAKQEKYHAHLIRDRNQGCFKQLVLDELPVNAFYLLADYWAKISIAKKGGTACCEGDSKGLSAHGSMFVYRNPDTNERRQISLAYPGTSIDWSKFGKAPDEGGLKFLEEHYNVYCNDSKQNNFHTKSTFDATFAAFLQQRPWLATKRASFVQSDNASNYRDPTTEIDLDCVGARCFSEAGMGKDEGDGNGAVIKGKIKRTRDEGHGIEGAKDLLDIGAGTGIAGQTHAMLNMNRSNEDGGVSGRDPVCRNFGFWTINRQYITFYESLDVEASRASMKAGGSPVGYGSGIKHELEEFSTKQRTQMAETGATLTHADGGSFASPNPKPRGSAKEKSELKHKKESEKLERAASADEKKSEEGRASKVHFGVGTDVCPRCCQHFLSKGWFNRHRNRWCRDQEAWKQSRRRERDVAARLAATDELLLQEYREKVAAMGTMTVTLKAPTSTPAAIGIRLESDVCSGGGYVVAAVSSLAEASAQIAPGFVVLGLARGDRPFEPPTSTNCFDGHLAAGESIVVTLRLPPVPIPYHGSARYGAHKNVIFKMHGAQRQWLEDNVFKGGMERLRPAPAHAAMKAAFKDQMRVDTMTPMWLDKDQIATWLAQKNKEEKERRRQAKKDGMTSVSVDDGDGDHRDPKKPRIVAHGKGKGKKQKPVDAAEGVSKRARAAGRDDEERSNLVESDCDGFSDSDDGEDE